MATAAPLSLEEMLQTISAGLKQQVNKPNIFGYTPHAKQDDFHHADTKGRLYIGGNRSGKSYASVAEDVWWLTNTHPYIETPEAPIRGRVVTVDFVYGLEQIIIPLFKILTPKRFLKNGSWDESYSKQYRTLTLTNGSTCEFMSYEQDTEKFAGTSRHFVHYDEEPPLHVFNECNARLVDTNGRWWISMTPVEGLTWTFEKVYEVGKANPKRIHITEADMLDNPHITPEAAEDYLSGLDDDERKAREHGTYVQLGGLVYKQFSIERHVVPIQIPPKNWLWYVSLDHGFNNPTGVLWHAVSPENTIITFAEYYERERTLDENAAAIKAKNKAFGKEPDFYVADPAIAQRSAHSGTSIQTEYAMRGLPFALGSNNVETGVAKVQAYLRNIPGTDTPRRVITENCESFITEMRKLRWKTYTGKKMQFDNNPQEKIHKKDDHLCDSDRYFHTFLPDLAPAPPPPVGLVEAPVEAHGGHRPAYGGIDEVLKAMGKMDESTGKFDWKITYGTDLSGLEYE